MLPDEMRPISASSPASSSSSGGCFVIGCCKFRSIDTTRGTMRRIKWNFPWPEQHNRQTCIASQAVERLPNEWIDHEKNRDSTKRPKLKVGSRVTFRYSEKCLVSTFHPKKLSGRNFTGNERFNLKPQY